MAIAYVSSGDLGNNGGTTNSLTTAYTCSSGANNLLLVGLIGGQTSSAGHDDITGLTYNGVAMTLAAKNAPAAVGGDFDTRYNYIYYLYLTVNAVPAGAHNVVISCTNNHYLIATVTEYSGVKQSGAVDSSNSNHTYNAAGGVSTLTTSVTTVARNCWAMMEVHSGLATAGTGATFRVRGAALNQPAMFDSAAAISSPGSYSMTTTDPGSGNTVISQVMAAFAPALSDTVFRRPTRFWVRRV